MAEHDMPGVTVTAETYGAHDDGPAAGTREGAEAPIVFRVFFKDSGPDRLGRRSFVLLWEEPDGVYRPEPSTLDGKPVGYRRAQVFFTVPAKCFVGLERQGHRVEIATEPDPYEVAHAKRAKSTTRARARRRTVADLDPLDARLRGEPEVER